MRARVLEGGTIKLFVETEKEFEAIQRLCFESLCVLSVIMDVGVTNEDAWSAIIGPKSLASNGIPY